MMTTNKKTEGLLKMDEKKEEYLAKMFSLLRKHDNIAIADKKTHFNNTELRMLSEIISAKYAGKRLISTQLAKQLGITRSAISQIVNRLEAKGIVKRVADEVDRKIAYIEISDGVLELYGEDIRNCIEFISKLIEEFGEERFDQLCTLYGDFMDLAQKKIKDSKINWTKNKIA